MATVRPFRSLRFEEAKAGPLEGLVAPPYDVISDDERARLRDRSPYNVVRLTLPDSEDEAALLLAAWRRDGVLVEDVEPSLWALEQDYVGPDGVARTRTGLVASLRAEPYETGVVLPHERTHRGPKEARLRLLRATRAHLEPIFLLYEGEAPFAVPGTNPELAAAGARLWRLPEAGEISTALADRSVLIADGHHRYETALAFYAEDGMPAGGFLPVVLVSTQDPGLTIFPTHRVLRDYAEPDGGFRVTPVAGGAGEALRLLEGLSRERPAFVLYEPGRAALVEASEPDGLDVAALERLRPDVASYTPRVEEAVAAVDSGGARAAALVRPPTVAEVASFARAGRTMPQKSTYFYPKLVSGLLIQPI